MVYNEMFDRTIDADLSIKNGRIATQDERRSVVEAAAIENGRFIAVGSERDVMAAGGDRTQIMYRSPYRVCGEAAAIALPFKFIKCPYGDLSIARCT